MKYCYEILFQDGDLNEEKWKTLLSEVSKFQGFFSIWHLYVEFIQNEIHFYIQVKYPMHPMMNRLPFCLFQKCPLVKKMESYKAFPIFCFNDEDFLTWYDRLTIKKSRRVRRLEFCFFYQGEKKIRTLFYLTYQRDGRFFRSFFALLSVPLFLSMDLKTTNRFLFKKIPKYLNIQKHLPLLQRKPNHSFLEVSTFPYQSKNAYFALEQYDFDKHSFILGGSGTGKSKFLSSFIFEIWKNKLFREQYKIIMIDPHASMEKDIGGLPNSKVIDFLEEESSLDLFSSSSSDVTAQVELYLSLFSMLIGENYNSKLERVFRFSLDLLLRMELFTFSNLRKLLTDTDYRTDLLNKSRTECSMITREFFLQDFYELKTKSYGEAIAPILSFLDELESLPVFQKEHIGSSLKEVIGDNFLTLISLDRTKMGDKITKMIAGFLMCQLLNLAGAYSFTEHLIFVVDEVAVVENPILCRFLSEARKYHLSVILVSQYFNQISKNLKDAILANVINYYVFRASSLDAEVLATEMNMSIANGDTKEEKVKMLTHLNHREGIIRVQKDGKLLSGMKIKTLDFKPIPRKKRPKKILEKESHQDKKAFSFLMNVGFSLKDFLKTISTSHKNVRDLP